jgi:hypothetical protein
VSKRIQERQRKGCQQRVPRRGHALNGSYSRGLTPSSCLSLIGPMLNFLKNAAFSFLNFFQIKGCSFVSDIVAKFDIFSTSEQICLIHFFCHHQVTERPPAIIRLLTILYPQFFLFSFHSALWRTADRKRRALFISSLSRLSLRNHFVFAVRDELIEVENIVLLARGQSVDGFVTFLSHLNPCSAVVSV